MASNGWQDYKKRKGIRTESEGEYQPSNSVAYTWEQYKAKREGREIPKTLGQYLNPVKRGTYKSEVTTPYSEEYAMFRGEDAPASSLRVGTGESITGRAKNVGAGESTVIGGEKLRPRTQQEIRTTADDLYNRFAGRQLRTPAQLEERRRAEQSRPYELEQLVPGISADAGTASRLDIKPEKMEQLSRPDTAPASFVGPMQQGTYRAEEQEEKTASPFKSLNDYIIEEGLTPPQEKRRQPGRAVGAGETALADPELIGYENLKRQPDYRQVISGPTRAIEPDGFMASRTGMSPGDYTSALTAYMNDEEKNNFTYLANKYGPAEAEKYYAAIEDELNRRQGTAAAQRSAEMPGWAREPYELFMAGASGFQSTLGGIRNAWNALTMQEKGEPIPASVYAAQNMRDNNGFWGKLAMDLAQSAGQQIPQMMIGSVTDGLGKVARTALTMSPLTASVIGNRYSQRLAEGYSPKDALKSSLASAVLETGLETIGGPRALSGGILSDKAIDKIVDGIEVGVKRFAARTGFDMLGEGAEEYLSGVLSPLIQNAILGEGAEEQDWGEIAYQTLVGTLSGGLLGTPGNIVSGVQEARTKAAQAAAQSVKSKETTPEQKHNAAKAALEIAQVENAEEIADTVVKMANGEEVAPEEIEAVATTEGALDVVKEIAAAETEQSAIETADETRQETEQETEQAPEGLEGEQLEAWSNRRQAIETAAKLGGERRIHEEIYDMGDGKQKAGPYIMEYERAYNRGRNEMGLTDKVASTYRTLTREQVQAAYNAGRVYGQRQIQKKATVRSANSMSGRPGYIDTSAIKNVRLNENQRSAVNASRFIAETLGVKVAWYASKTNEQGKRTSPNGWYDGNDQSIHLDIYAGSNTAGGEGMYRYAAMRTFAHELTHYIEDVSPAQYDQLRRMVFTHLGKNGYNVETLISEKQASGKGISRFAATQEVVADACEMMLRDSTTMQTAAQQNPRLWEKIKERFAKFVEDLRNALQGVRATSKEAIALMKEADGVLKYAEDLQKKWDEALLSTMEEKKNPAEEQRNTEQYAPRNYDVEISQNEIDSNIELVKKMEPVVMLKGDEAILHDRNLKENVLDFYQKNGNVATNRVLGDVQLTKSSYKSDMGHGMTPLKALTFWAVPGTIEKGEIISYSENWKDRGYRTYVIAAPITIEQGERRGDYWSGVVVKADANMQNVYAHDALMIKKEGPAALQNGAAANAGDTVGYRSSIHKILQQLNEVKREEQKEATVYRPETDESARYSLREPVADNAAFQKWFGESKVVNADGTPMVVYHGTDAYDQINVFKRGKKGWLGPGIYLAQDKNDAQHYADKSGYGGRVYELYARAENPLVVTQSNPVPEILQAAYNRSSIYEKRSAKQANDVSILTPADIKKLQEKGYDGIVWKFGKRPWEINVFSPEQLKSATDNTGAYSRESKDIRYQARETGQISDRELLATATNSVARNAKEREALARHKTAINEYLRKQTVAENLFEAMRKPNISREAMLARQQQYQEILEEIDELDRQLLAVEYDEVVQGIISRERKYIREREDKARTDAVQKYREKRNAAEARAVVRRIITGTVKRLHNRLERPTPEHFVNDDMRRSIETLVKAFSPEGTFSKENLADVQSAYKNMFGNPDEIDATGFDDRTYENLGDLRNQLDGKKLTELTMNQLRMLRESIENIFHVIQHEETTFVQGRRENVAALASAVEAEAKDQGEYIERQGLEGARDFLNNGNATPIYFFKRIGGTLQRLFNEFIDGEGVYARDMQEAGDKIRELKKKYHYDEWADKDDDRLTFVTTFGQEITLDRETALGLWATRQREMRDPENEVQHLKNGGFQYEEREWEKRKNKILDKIPLGKKRTGTKPAYRLADEDNNRIAAWLTPEQRGYATEMVEYLSTNMAEKGNEISRKLRGYSIFGEGFYYPYKSSSLYMSESLDKIESAMLKNSGFTKKITKNASNPIVAGRFTDVWADHVNRMSMYHAMAIPQDSFWRVYNNRTPSSKEDGYASVKAAINGAYGSGANKYIKQLMTDIYGGVASAYGDSIAGQMMSKFKKNAVAMSMSVVVQQPSSIARAFAVINPKYFVNTKGVSRKRAKADMMKYSATAFVKGMGRFDMNAGRSATEWLLKRDLSDTKRTEKVKAFFKDPSMRDDVFGFLPQIMDEMTWAQIWNAAKAETAEKTKLTGEELLKATAERFDDVIRQTQVYDSVLVRSQFMRSKSAYAKMATAFMAEPTLSYNMMMEAARVAKTDKKTASAIVGSVTAAAVLNAVLKSFVSAYRDKDEDETYVEKYFASLVSDLTGDVLNTKQGPASVVVGLMSSSLLPFGNIPLVQDAISIFQGYDVTRSDMNILVDAHSAYMAAFNDDKSLYEQLYAAAKPISALTGYPISNVWRDAEGIVNLISNDKREWQDTTARGIKYAILSELGRKGTQTAETERMLDAALRGDDEAYEKLEAHLINDMGMTQKDVTSKMKSRIRERHKAGEISDEQAVRMLELHGGLADEADDKYAAERQVREWTVENETGEGSPYARVWEHITVWDGNALQKEIKELRALGVKDSTIVSSVTGHFKSEYLAATGREKADLKAHLITAYTYLGMSRDEAMSKIDKWSEE